MDQYVCENIHQSYICQSFLSACQCKATQQNKNVISIKIKGQNVMPHIGTKNTFVSGGGGGGGGACQWMRFFFH